jgi:hypothetical protein
VTRFSTAALIFGLTALTACAGAQAAPATAQAQPAKPQAPAAPPAPATTPQGQPVNAQAQQQAPVLQDFKKRIDEYVKLREQADNTAKPQKTTAEAGDIKEAQMSLAERIGLARKGAKQGDIFTPDVAALFKRLLHWESKETGTKEGIKEDNPGEGVPFKINGPYPDKEPLSTVPANVLQTLPQLPKDLEYRFVKKHMILRDARANLIIDYMLNAIP